MTDKIPYYLDKRNENLVDVINGIEYTEEWRPVVGYYYPYEVSSFGRVRGFSDGGSFIKNQHFNKKKYLLTAIREKEKYNRPIFVHRLVADAFLENEKNKPQVNHIDGIKCSNFYKNLEWATNSENQLHSVRTGLRVMPKGKDHYWYGKKGHPSLMKNKRKGASNNKSKLVLDLNTGIYYENLREACDAKGIEKYKNASYQLIKYKEKSKIGLVYA